MQKYMVIYELDSPATTETKEWADAGAFGDWAARSPRTRRAGYHGFFKKV